MVDVSSFRIDPKPNKYLSHVFDLILSMQQATLLRLDIKNEDEENIKNLFDYNQILDLHFPASKRVL